MLYVVVAAKGFGKTTLIRDAILPIMLHRPSDFVAGELLPPRGYAVALVDDPARPSTGRQYRGDRYDDVAAWRRAQHKGLRSCFDNAEPAALMALALQIAADNPGAGALLVPDELDRYLPKGQRLAKGSDSDRIINEGRHYGVCCVGTVRSLRALHPDVRDNIEGAWIGNLASAEGENEKYAAQLIGLSRRGQFKIGNDANIKSFRDLGRGEFLFWNREDRRIVLTKHVGGVLHRSRVQGI
jgi:hypothetical protein